MDSRRKTKRIGARSPRFLHRGIGRTISWVLGSGIPIGAGQGLAIPVGIYGLKQWEGQLGEGNIHEVFMDTGFSLVLKAKPIIPIAMLTMKAD